MSIIIIDDAHFWFYKEAVQQFGSLDYQQHLRLVLTLANTISMVRDLRKRAKIVLIYDSNSKLHPFISRFVEQWIYIEVPSADEQLRVWIEILGEVVWNGTKISLDNISAINDMCHGWVLSDIVDVCLKVKHEESRDKNFWHFLESAVQKHKPTLFRSDGGDDSKCPWTLIPSHKVSITWDSIGGLELTKQAIKEVVVWPLIFEDEIRILGLRSTPSGVLLYGPPGTGKTLLAAAAAKESSANFMTVSIGDIIRGHVGESENLLARVFSMARNMTPCILFFDEFQALFGRRDSSGEVGRKLISQFLLETDRRTPGLFLFAATNIPEAIDPALLRPGRFDRKIYVPLPDSEGRKIILENMRKEMNSWEANVDIHELVRCTEGFSGAEIHVLCQKAAMLAIEQGKNSVDVKHFSDVLTNA